MESATIRPAMFYDDGSSRFVRHADRRVFRHIGRRQEHQELG